MGRGKKKKKKGSSGYFEVDYYCMIGEAMFDLMGDNSVCIELQGSSEREGKYNLCDS